MNNGNSRFIFILDLVIIFAAFYGIYLQYNGHTMISLKAILLMAFVALMWFLISINSNVVRINTRSKVILVLKDIIVGYSVLSVAVITTVAIFGEFRPNDKLVLFPLLFAVIWSTILRLVYLTSIKHFIKNGFHQKSVLLIGGSRVAERVMDLLLTFPELGYCLYGILSDDYYESMPKEHYLGKLERFKEIVRTKKIDEVIIAKPLRKEETILNMVEQCEYEGIRFRIVPDFFRIIPNQAVIENLGDIPLIAIRTEPLNILSNRIIKRTFDIVFSLVVLVLLLPVFLILSILIKITSKGTVFFKQKRIGANNVEFNIYKFRSMTVQKSNDSDILWTKENDQRVTSTGRFMRKTNLDELPQLWNVLIGNMSLVGPRPERGHFVEKFKKGIPHYKVRHLVKSGITGWAQVNGWRGDTSIANRVEHDIFYLENWSFWFDLKILWLTLFGRETNKNAY
ncbi:MAG: undecaprenyl-phosphate glucose phosphotransferase [Thermodesulfobacteriota bacterium]|nr:undecaprenyl-phosphate glucose phosphotransferase [Thermodesulfobacteriota bacterium]